VRHIQVSISIELPDAQTDTGALTTAMFVLEHCIEDAEMRNPDAKVIGSSLALVNGPVWPTEHGDVIW
jgi:hypothetical protein